MRRKTMLAGVLGLGVLGLSGTLAISAAAAHSATGATRPTAVDVALPANAADNSQRSSHLRVELKDVHGKRAAQVDIARLEHGGNQVTVHAWNLTPGFHAIHIHAVGVCDPAGVKPFASAGGHFNPTGKPEGMQAGAFPVLLAGANGEAQAQFTDGNFAIGDLFGPAGTAIVIHAAPDNYANVPPRYLANGVAGPDTESQMTGDAGTRIACGVLSPTRVKPSGGMPSAGTSASTGKSTKTSTSGKSSMAQMPGM
jgi:Cu-Zn family superoxide dismutase